MPCIHDSTDSVGMEGFVIPLPQRTVDTDMDMGSVLCRIDTSLFLVYLHLQRRAVEG